MKTSKPISTVSFNTPVFLYGRLADLVRAGVLSWWVAVPHLSEDDEGGKKDHIHLYCEPSRLLQTDDLCSEFLEFDPARPDKPLSVLRWQLSKFDDWVLYGLHDVSYLASKGLTKKYHYDYDDLVSSDPDTLLYRFRSVNVLAVTPIRRLIQYADKGLSFSELLALGVVPVPQVRQYREVYDLLLGLSARRLIDNLDDVSVADSAAEWEQIPLDAPDDDLPDMW